MSEVGKCTPSAAGDSCDVADVPKSNINEVKLDATITSEDVKASSANNDTNAAAQEVALSLVPGNTIEKNGQISDNGNTNAAGEPCAVGVLKSLESNSAKEAAISMTENVDLKACTADKTETSIIIENQTTGLAIQEEKNQTESVDTKIGEENASPKNESIRVPKLEKDLQVRTEERDDYQKKLTETEKKLADLQASYDAITSGDSDEATLRRTMEQLRTKLTQTTLQLEDRGRIVVNQENQINALNNQVTSLKEVVAITRDLLQIRNMEVKHLQHEIDAMETRISEEHERHNTMLSKMDAAVRLNADLKKEYETQLGLFQDLRGKYEEKVTLLSAEKEALESAVQAAAK